MSKRFEPHRRLLTTLIGSNLYGAPDACVRELLQNSWDAIQLRKQLIDGQGGQISVRYSVHQRWFEVIDDGIGMDQRTIEESFFEVGQDKLEILKVENSPAQIGYFGIGILSVFLIADRFEVFTKPAEKDTPATYFEVTDIDKFVKYKTIDVDKPGTRIKVYPKDSVEFSIERLPEVIKSYARHVPGISIHSVDSGEVEVLKEYWATDNFEKYFQIEGVGGITSGRVSFLPALKRNSGTLENQITICNVGFLVEENIEDLVPLNTIGVGGEINLESTSINIGMSRERIQRDQRWADLGLALQEFLVCIAVDELERGDLKEVSSFDSDQVKRNILLWYHFIPPEPPFSHLHEILDRRVYETVPFSQSERPPRTLAGFAESVNNVGKLYFRQKSINPQRREDIDDDGLPVRFYQEVRDSVRIGALRAKGFSVIELNLHQVNVKSNNTVQTLQIPELSLVERCLKKRGIELVNIVDAPESDMDMKSIEKLPILRSALTAAGGLTFAAVPDSKRRVISDQSGTRYINLRNEAIQRLLKLIPDATSNPLKHKLLEAYLRLEDFKLQDTREILLDLLGSDDLEYLANSEMAPLTKAYVAKRISELLREMES